MPFSPLPKTFVEDLHQRRHGRVVELGCADGQMSELMVSAGAEVLRVDRRPLQTGTVADLVADALALPLAPGSVDFLVAAGLLRHLWPLTDSLPVPLPWQLCLKPQGRLYVLEDEPVAEPEATRNYRDLQIFLARIVGAGRRPLLPRQEFKQATLVASPVPGHWRLGWQRNDWPADGEAVIELLTGVSGQVTGEARRLVESIGRHGLSYGTCWWACWEPEVLV